MADPRRQPTSPRNEPASPAASDSRSQVSTAQPRSRHSYARWAIRLSAIAFCHNPDTSDALFKATITDFAREGVRA